MLTDTQILRVALDQGEPIGDHLEHSKRALAQVKSHVLQRLPKATRAGQLRRILEVQFVEVAPISVPRKRRRA